MRPSATSPRSASANLGDKDTHPHKDTKGALSDLSVTHFRTPHEVGLPPRHADLESHFRLSAESTKKKPAVLKEAAPTCAVSAAICQKLSSFPKPQAIRKSKPHLVEPALPAWGAALPRPAATSEFSQVWEGQAVRLQRLAAEALHAPLCALLAGAASPEGKDRKKAPETLNQPAGRPWACREVFRVALRQVEGGLPELRSAPKHRGGVHLAFLQVL